MDKKIKILTVANRKGGAGKSTCAVHIAAEAVKSGYKVLLIDLDPQKTLENWWKNRKEDPNPHLTDVNPYFKPNPENPDQPIEVKIGEALPEKLETLQKVGFNLCIIDTPGDTSENAEAGIAAADVVVIPSKPTSPDLRAIGRTISEVKKKAKPFIFIVTQTTPRTTNTITAISSLAKFGPVAPKTMGNRQAYQTAMELGISAADTETNAAVEMSGIWEYIESILFDNPKEQGNDRKEKI